MNTSQRPVAGEAREYHFPKFERRTLTNGLELVIAPIHKLPVVTVLAVVNAGATLDPPGQEGLAQLTAEALREGTATHSGVDIVESVELLGSSLEAGADWDSTVVSMTLLSERLADGLSLMAEVLTSPSFPEHEVERLKAERLAERMQILSEPRALADESFSGFLYTSDSRYGEPMSGSSASISGITRANVADFFRSRYTPDSVTIIMAGDIDCVAAEKLISETLGDWTGKSEKISINVAKEARVEPALEIVAKPDSAQAELRLGHKGMLRSHPDYFRVVVMNAILGGLFSSRINLNLREQHGYTYGASSFFDWRRDEGPFVIATAVQSEVAADALRETLKEIDGMRSKEVSVDELTLATSYLEGVFPIRYETTSAIASALANLIIFNLPENFYDEYRRNILEITPGDVLRAAQNHVHPEKLQATVVGDPALVKGPLEELKFGKVSVRANVEA